jgi:hypothetical protein
MERDREPGRGVEGEGEGEVNKRTMSVLCARSTPNTAEVRASIPYSLPPPLCFLSFLFLSLRLLPMQRSC